MTFINEAAREFDMSTCDVSGVLIPDPPLCERTLSIVLDGLKQQAEAMTRQGDMSGRNGQAIAFVESILPKPDRAKELAEEWMADHQDPLCADMPIAIVTSFARWLTNKGMKL